MKIIIKSSYLYIEKPEKIIINKIFLKIEIKIYKNKQKKNRKI